ncbi:MAG: glycosyltransferase family 9 protein [Selenomonadaceae bacterium]
MTPKNILIVKLSAIGDVIHALPVSYAIKETFPEARVTWVVEPPAYDLLVNNPYIDEIILFEKKKFKSFWGFIKNINPFRKKLQQHKYDVVLDLQGLFKSAVIAWLSGADVKLGCANMREGSDKISRPVSGLHADGHIVERYLDVVRELGCRVETVVFPMEVTGKEADIACKLITQAGADINNAYVVLAPGANWPNKRWPTKYYADLVDWLYNQKIIPVIIGGGVVDERLAAEIEAAAEIPPVNLVGRTTLKQVAYIIKRAQAVVGGDTGPVHLGAGLGAPTVMVMGPTDAKRNGPYGQLENAIEVAYDCRWCWKRQCRFSKDCLLGIDPEIVKNKLRQILQLP